MEFLTGRDYPHLCKRCQAAIDACEEVVIEGPDTDDIEAPFMFAADHLLLCGGSTCKGPSERGDEVLFDSGYCEQKVTLVSFHPRGGFWICADENGEEVLADPDELEALPKDWMPPATSYDFYVWTLRSDDGGKPADEFVLAGHTNHRLPDWAFYDLAQKLDFPWLKQDGSLVGGYYVDDQGACLVCVPHGSRPEEMYL